MSDSLFLEPVAKLLLYLHFIGVIVLAGSLTHNVLLVYNYLRKRYIKRRLEKFYVKVSCITYALVFGLGALLYPVFRVRVRAEYFDTTLPWATGLFEIKEHWAALGLGLFLAYYGMSRWLDPKKDRAALVLYAALGFTLWLICFYLITSGFYLTTLKSV